MKINCQYLKYGIFFFLTACIAGCEDDMGSNSSDAAILLTAGGADIKAPGHGQYKLAVLSGDEISVAAGVASSQIQSLTITKTVNLAVDPVFGDNGVLTVDPASFDSEYIFNYSPPVTDIDQLVGFTFRVENSNGSTQVSDLTLVVTLSPRDNLPFRRWNLVSRLYVDGGNSEDLKECEKDDYYLFNGDGTMSLHYGTDTAAGDCALDGLTEYDTWELSEDEKFFIMKRHGIFSPDVTETQTYRVALLTTEKLELEIDLDLSFIGLSTKETFKYKMEAAPL